MNFYGFTADAGIHLDRTGLRRKEIARRSGITHEFLSRLESRRYRTSGPFARRLAKTLAEELEIDEEHAFTLIFEPAPTSRRSTEAEQAA
jgi:transcriptional regulator with XRE-family HTH domain